MKNLVELKYLMVCSVHLPVFLICFLIDLKQKFSEQPSHLYAILSIPHVTQWVLPVDAAMYSIFWWS